MDEVIKNYHGAHIDSLGFRSDGFMELSEKGIYVARAKAFSYFSNGVLLAAEQKDISRFFDDNAEPVAEGACTLVNDGIMRAVHTGYGDTADLYPILCGVSSRLQAVFHSGEEWWNALEQMFTKNGRPKFAKLSVEEVQNCYRDFSGVRFYDVNLGKEALRQYLDDLSIYEVPKLKEVVEITTESILPLDAVLN